MSRPPKYATAREAAEQSLYSKMGGASIGYSLSEFIAKVTQNCTVCGREPTEVTYISRKSDSYTLHWNYIVKHKTVCGTCKKLAIHFDLDHIVRHCARIMAKRMHDKRRAVVSPGPGKTLIEILVDSPCPDIPLNLDGREHDLTESD